MKKWTYYNDSDPKVCAWVRELMKAGLIQEGEVDERSICDVDPSEVINFRRCHFFCGIAGWEYALRLAGVPEQEPLWTGSCPCQPFSGAGKRLGTADARHLWPEFARLIGACHPATVLGEQVASPDGRAWLAGVHTDLEALGFDFGAADLPSGGVSAPHNRARLYWVAHSKSKRWDRSAAVQGSNGRSITETDCVPGRVDNPRQQGLEGHAGDGDNRDQPGRLTPGEDRPASQAGGSSELDSICMGDTASGRNGPAQNDGGQSEVTGEGRVCGTGGPGNANELRPDGLANPQCYRQPEGRNGDHGRDDGPVFNPANFWSNYDIAICDDLDKEGRRKARRVESSTFPLAHGVSNRVGLLRGYGNAINPVLAAEFIKAAFGAIEDTRANP